MLKMIKMPKRKTHNWKANPNIKGFYRCTNCNCEMQYRRNVAVIFKPNGIVDNSLTKLYCYKATKAK